MFLKETDVHRYPSTSIQQKWNGKDQILDSIAILASLVALK